MKKILIPLFVIYAVLTNTVAYSQEKAKTEFDKLIYEIQENLSSVKSYSANFDMAISIGSNRSTVKGTILFKTPGKIKMLMEVEKPEHLTQQTICDGKTLWQYIPEKKTAYRYDLTNMTKEQKQTYISQGDLTQPFKDMDWKTIIYKSSGRIGQERVYLFEGKPNLLIAAQDPENFKKMRVWVSADDGLIRRIVIYDANEKAVMSQNYTKIATNIKISKKEFEFIPPPGIKIGNMVEY